MTNTKALIIHEELGDSYRMARDFTLMGNALYDTANFKGALE
jgi:hypothetical protein